MNTINIVIGDWSDDGHGKTDTITISSNLTSKQIETAYKKGSKKIGFNLTGEVACDYEDHSLPDEYIEKLVAHGCDVRKFVDDEGMSLWTDSFAKIWLHIVSLGDPGFKYKITKNVDIRIGGYGLFR